MGIPRSWEERTEFRSGKLKNHSSGKKTPLGILEEGRWDGGGKVPRITNTRKKKRGRGQKSSQGKLTLWGGEKEKNNLSSPWPKKKGQGAQRIHLTPRKRTVYLRTAEENSFMRLGRNGTQLRKGPP